MLISYQMLHFLIAILLILGLFIIWKLRDYLGAKYKEKYWLYCFFGYAVTFTLLFSMASQQIYNSLRIFRIYPYMVYKDDPMGVTLEAKKAFARLEKLSGRKWKINSAYRSPTTNSSVGGASKSMHMQGHAFDVVVAHKLREEFFEAAINAGFSAFGWGNNIVHIDMGPRRWWTYSASGKAMSGTAKCEFINKAPDNFIKDFRVKC